MMLWGVHISQAAEGDPATSEAPEVTFEIREFQVDGNTLIPAKAVQTALAPFTGPGKTAGDVEKARTELEALFRSKGYPTVIVNIPEQRIGSGSVRLEVIQGRIRAVKVTGNLYFTKEKILEDLPSFAPGEVLYMPRARRELGKINRNPDFKVAPVLMPGKYPGTVDVEMKVKDRFPLHGSLEVNNRSSHDTSELRLNGVIHYDNLWQKEHSISFQYQTSPLEPSEVQALAASYLLHSPWNDDHLIAIFGVWSDSDTAFGEGFEVVGSGFITGVRYVMPLPEYKTYSHSMTLGIDYKDFDEALNYSGTEDDETVPIRYVPLSVAYRAQLPDGGGDTTMDAGLQLGIRGAVDDRFDFDNKRFQARGNFAKLTLGLERNHKLPARFRLHARADGQLADQPLISNEQFFSGGMSGVRGYKESEALGDDGVQCILELRAPDLVGIFEGSDDYAVNPFLFYDIAGLRIQDPLPEEKRSDFLQGAGLGVRGFITHYVSYEADWGIALADTKKTDAGTNRLYFKVKAAF